MQIPLRRVGRVLFVGLPGHDLGPLEQQLGIDVGAVEDSFIDRLFLGRFRIEFPCNWKDFGSQIEHALESPHAREWAHSSVHLGMPNMVVVDSTVGLTVLCAKPVNQARIEISIACYGEAGAEFAAIELVWRRILEGRASVRFDPRTHAAKWASKMMLHAETAG
jgi:hypothetical protein